MPHLNHPSAAPGAQDKPQTPDSAPSLAEGHTTKAMAERHERLWLSLHQLHKDIVALGAKKPGAPVSDPVRVTAESLLSDSAAFTRKRGERLPVAAPDLAGLAVQLGQALARLEEWESHHTGWDERFSCRIWSLHSGYLPIMRLKPPKAALKQKRENTAVMREKLVQRLMQRQSGVYEDGFAAGRAARQGAPEEPEQPLGESNPRIHRLG